MKKWQFSIAIFLIFFVLFTCCDNELTRTKWYPNPNGDSELALLMREMYDDVLMMKTKVKANQVPQVSIDHSRILTATPTESGKVESKEYRDNAHLYLKTIESIKKSDYLSSRENYQNVVGSCISCHRSACPGPVVKIEKLFLEKD